MLERMLMITSAYASELVNVSASSASLSLALLNGMLLCVDSSPGSDLTSLSGMSLVSRLMYGTLSDYVSPLLLASVSASATGIVTFTLWGVAGSSLAGVLAFGSLFGILIGGWSSLWTGFIRPVSSESHARQLFCQSLTRSQRMIVVSS